MANPDYYQILGVAKSATADDIRKTYRKLARENHPDVKKDDPAAAQRFKEIQEAYAVLGDDEKRQQYDRFGRSSPKEHNPVVQADLEAVAGRAASRSMSTTFSAAAEGQGAFPSKTSSVEGALAAAVLGGDPARGTTFKPRCGCRS